MVANVGKAFGQLTEHRLHCALGVGNCLAGRRRLVADRRCRRQRPAEDGGHEVQDGHDHDQRLGTRQRYEGRSDEGEAERKGRVHGQGEQPVRRKQLASRHQERDHRRLGRPEEGRDSRHEDHQQVEKRQVLVEEDDPEKRQAAEHVGDEKHVALVDAVDKDACNGREDDRRDQEAQEQSADGRGRAEVRGDQDRQAIHDHTAADLRRELGQPQKQERAIPQDGQGARFLHRLCRGGGPYGSTLTSWAYRAFLSSGAAWDVHRTSSLPGVDSCASRGVGATARLKARSPLVTKSVMRRSSVRRSRRTCRWHIRHRRPMSAPSRSTSHS